MLPLWGLRGIERSSLLAFKERRLSRHLFFIIERERVGKGGCYDIDRSFAEDNGLTSDSSLPIGEVFGIGAVAEIMKSSQAFDCAKHLLIGRWL